jgi:DNA invertase Pin-like site-specific DNA recombinase
MPPPPKPRTAIYARVSTADQTVQNQLPALRQYAKARGWKVAHELVDRASGSNQKRPGFEELISLARRRAIDAILVYRLDRFGRSTRELLNTWSELDDLGVRFVSLSEQMDFGSAAGKVMFAVISAMAEFERDLIRERVKIGMARARAEGKHVGRPTTLPITEIRRRLGRGDSPSLIARELGVARASIYRVWVSTETSRARTPRTLPRPRHA